MTPLDPDQDPPAPISVADILRREGLRGPHAASGRLRPRGHAKAPIPTLSAPRHGSGRGRRAAVAAAALAAIGTVLGATDVQDAVPGAREADGPPDSAAGIATGRTGPDGPAIGSGVPARLITPVALLGGTGAPVTPADLADLGRDTRPAPGHDTPGHGSPDDSTPVPGASGGPPAGAGDPTPPDREPDAGRHPGGGGPGSGSDPDVPDDPDSGDSGDPDSGDDRPTLVLPELRAPAAVPAAPAIRPGTVTVTAEGAQVTGPDVTTDAARRGPVAAGAAEIDGPELGLSTSDNPALDVSAAEIETPALDVAGVGVDLPDIATPPLRLPLG